MSYEKPMTKVLIFGGKTGWIGGKMYDMCKEKGRLIITKELCDLDVFREIS